MAEQLSLNKDYMALDSFFRVRERLGFPQRTVGCLGPCKITSPHLAHPQLLVGSRQDGNPGAHQPQGPSTPPVTRFPCPCYLIKQR